MRLFTLPAMRLLVYCQTCNTKSKWRFLFLFFSLALFVNNIQAQPAVTVKGVVTLQNGEPVTGASVVIKGTGKGTTTQVDGSFQIEAPSNATLVITHTGYAGQEIRLTSTNHSGISIRLIENKNSLDEVIVVGYGTRKKSDVTGAITSIREQQIKDIPAANLAQAMQGQGAGVDIVKSGGNNKPGSSPSILIRGTRSVIAGNNPLIVVDGIPYIGNLNDLNQNDVVSIEV